MTEAFLVKDGQVFINKAFVKKVKASYPVAIASDNHEWVVFKDGHLEIRDHNGILRVKTFTQGSI